MVGAVVEGHEPLSADPYRLADPSVIFQQPSSPESGPLQDPYIRFGERIIVRTNVGGEPLITKPYTMPAGKADKLVDLMGALRPFALRNRAQAEASAGAAPDFDPGVLEYQILPKWDAELFSSLEIPFSAKPPAAPIPVELSDVMVVTASYHLLEQFEDFLDLFAAAGVPQIELEAKIIEVVESDQLDLGVNASAIFGSKNFVRDGGFDLPNITSGTEALLHLGAVQNSLTFDAVLEAVRTWDNVQIDSLSKTVVRAGGVAYIESTTELPYNEIKTISDQGNFTAATVRQKVGVQLYISPRLIGTKMLALDVYLIGSQQVGSKVTFSVGDNLIEVPVIASRTAKTLVYLEPGQTLVIGGLTTQRDRELISKVPILGDIPLLGLLFRSKFTRTEKQHVLFAISPRILQHSDFETEF